MGTRRNYTGTDIEISFDAERCIHARNCVLKLGAVFDSGSRPWIRPDGASAEEAAAVIRTCPSGALAFRRLDGGHEETPPSTNRIAVEEDGPLALHGDMEIAGQTAVRATLCRCGLSKHKPYCDNSHIDGGFRATGQPEPEGGDNPDAGGGRLEVSYFENGPYQVTGSYEITTATGRRVGRGTKAFLCRCGHSGNKPYCDGSHKRAGFSAPGPEEG